MIGVEISRSFGDCIVRGGGLVPIPGVSGIPTLSVYKKPKNGHLMVCSDGISKILDPKDITKIARKARNDGIHDIAHTIVDYAHDSHDDNTSMDVPLNEGCVFGLVTDGHGAVNKEKKNPVVAIIENNIDPLLKGSASAVQQLFSKDISLKQLTADLRAFIGANTSVFSRVFNNTNNLNRQLNILEDNRALSTAKKAALDEIIRIFEQNPPGGSSYTLRRLVKNVENEQNNPLPQATSTASPSHT
jgi:hypothetical protein